MKLLLWISFVCLFAAALIDLGQYLDMKHATAKGRWGPSVDLAIENLKKMGCSNLTIRIDCEYNGLKATTHLDPVNYTVEVQVRK